jgi:hypothetical protein
MGSFSRAGSASGKAPCVACCRAEHARDDELSKASTARIAAFTGGRVPPGAAAAPSTTAGSPSARLDSDCARQARALAPVVARFDRYREALPSARAAADLNELGDQPGGEPSSKPCLTRLPVEADRLNDTLGMPSGTLKDTDLRDDHTGFRAALYRDEGTGRMILVPRDTQPDSLVDWQANTRNGIGTETPQYKAMRHLTGKLAANDQVFDIAGYSKGGGLAQEGGLIAPSSRIRLFNSAGVPDAMLGWTGQTDFASLTERSRLFSAEGDFLTFMNTTSDPGQDIINARYLRNELAGVGSIVAPIDIKTRNPAMRGQPDPMFASQKAAYLRELDSHIEAMQTAYDTGADVAGFPPVRAAGKETIANSSTWIGNLLGANGDQPTLGKLNQHKMQVVLNAMEADVKDDRQALQRFMKACG